jgi:hypothetical protein
MAFGDEGGHPGAIVVILAIIAGGGLGNAHEMGVGMGAFIGLFVGIFLAIKIFPDL